MSEVTAPGPATTIEHFLARCADRRGALLPLLHELQRDSGHISDEAVPLVADALNLSRAEVHGVVSFYPDFRREPLGRHIVKLCRAEACQARGAARIERLAVNRLAVAMGSTRSDRQISLEPVYCLGLCAIGPAALVDGRPVAGIDDAGIEAIAAEVAA
jgi:formate dehydrogenase subunit gamma